MITSRDVKLHKINGVAVASSLDIATHYKLDHQQLLTHIRKVRAAVSPEFKKRNFLDALTPDGQPFIWLTDDGFVVVAPKPKKGLNVTACHQAYIVAFIKARHQAA